MVHELNFRQDYDVQTGPSKAVKKRLDKPMAKNHEKHLNIYQMGQKVVKCGLENYEELHEH